MRLILFQANGDGKNYDDLLIDVFSMWENDSMMSAAPGEKRDDVKGFGDLLDSLRGCG